MTGSPLLIAVVAGTSMEPSLRSGDLVVGLAKKSSRRGDVVIFRDEMSRRLIIHRISLVQGDVVMTRGDNTGKGIQEVISSGDILATVVLRIPRAGHGIMRLKKMAGNVFG